MSRGLWWAFEPDTGFHGFETMREREAWRAESEARVRVVGGSTLYESLRKTMSDLRRGKSVLHKVRVVK